MKKIGLISDTHSYLHPKIFEYFIECDEIWHAGDVGNASIIDELAKFKTIRAVYGNIDGQEIRKVCPKNQRFICEEVDVWITHIGGYPDRYSSDVREDIKKNPPNLFISGHSHILKVMYDKKLNLLHMNPGAAGKYGIHKLITMLRFSIDGKEIKNLEVIELPKN
ncbi:MAG: YfcE family phosphodiesterase [Flavobacteriales bacterium]|nr:YfcE family phosphodiesterase [Flavobacteriales bacterium]|tara:strand:+ start:2930 stop:3424 length:495 start_codon:yes stop_codon:yes gene_type:complete